jgi:lambda family phage tail tape measure protein
MEGFKNSVLDTAAYGERIFNTMSQGFTDAIMGFVETGKLSFKDLFKSLMAEIIKMQANKIFLALFSGAQSFFAGLFDKGGYIPAGQFGIAGERGPEIVNGPARITGTDATAKMLGGGKSAPSITYNINAVDVQSFRQALARDPEYIYNLTRVGARRVPG